MIVYDNQINNIIIPAPVPPPYNQEENGATSIMVSGTSSHNDNRNSEKLYTIVINPIIPNLVQVTNGADIQSTKQVQLELSSKLSRESQNGHTHNDLKYGTLISVGRLYDNNYVALLSNHNMNIFKNGKFIIKGP